MADAFVEAVTDGPLLVAAPVAATAGLVSFLSPCVLPLVPGYLSYVTGLTGAEHEDGTVQTRVRTVRVVAGATLFVLGFSAVFVTAGAFFGNLGNELVAHRDVVERVLGVLTVLMGLAFLGLVPGLQRELRVHRLPQAGLAGAPLLGVVFGVGWTPCLGPTLAAVQTLAYTQASAGRGALLTAAYCLGLGLPFVLTAVAMERAVGAFAVVKRHYGLITRAGGVLLVVVGLLLVSGAWNSLMVEVRGWIAGFETAV